MRKRLVIDGNSMVYRSGSLYLPGIGRTTYELANALLRLAELPFDLTIFTQTIRGRLAMRPDGFRHVNLPIPPGNHLEWMYKRVPLVNMVAPHDLLHVPHNYAPVFKSSRTVVTIHDAMFFSYPEDFLGHDYAREHYPSLARTCRAIITCSKSSKEDIVTFMGVSPEKVTVAYWGVNGRIFYPSDKKDAFIALRKSGFVDRPFFVSVSCDRGRKNTIAVMRAFRLALQRRLEHDLVLVWGNPPAEYLEEFAPEIQSGRIRMLSHVDDDQLRLLYTASTLSWFPSKYEGFGLPLLESMACGTPVVTCRNSSLTEAGGDAALYVEPDDFGGMADLMIEFDRGFRGYWELVKRSIEHAAGFSWQRTAESYVKFYTANM
ncbi:MAG: glycosyltransferase family 4 protein [Chlorobium sp.]|uniref:glycosyltransferase family 4 protein n=1 Tax=Chlorobium sp. TaxID=1095 RepID=UPI0025C6091D|nr:glycosyltransferase family 1 protein [Chlorobium sp.]MCF8383432.1 glycosyltransferase family 4 protein [Chlorobium sp.]